MNSDLYLTRCLIKTKPIRGYSAEYCRHQLVSDLFGQYTQRPYLWRLNRSTTQGDEVLVLSTQAPEEEQGIMRPYGSLSAVESKPYPDLPAAGVSLDFVLRINATQKSKEGQRWDVLDAARRRGEGEAPEEVYRQYLERQFEGAAEVTDTSLIERGTQVISALGGTAGRIRRMTAVVAGVQGRLRLQDPKRVREIMAHGIGRQKAFGCGLLCLLPLGSLPEHTAGV